MADKTGISWTDATWNPTTGCDRVSPGCANCYALTLAPRLQAMAQRRGPTDPYMRDGDPKTSGVGFGLMMHESRLDQPLRWKRPRRIFVNSMSDLFHLEVTDAFLDQCFAVMALAPQHVFQVLTKRPERMVEYMNATWGHGRDEPQYGRADRVWDAMKDLYAARRGWTGGEWPSGTELPFTWPLPNVWMGTSVENARWRSRIDLLRQVPAAVRFLSCEPLLGPLVLGQSGPHPAVVTPPGNPAWLDLTGIEWVIVGGESGPGARPMDEQWVRDIVAACREQGAAPFVKQMGSVWSEEHLGHPGHAAHIEEFPADLRVQEFPR